MLEAGVVERLADGAHLPVEHRRRRDDVGPRPRLTHRRLRQQLQRLVVQDFALAHHAAVAVRGVLAQARVGDDDHLGRGAAHGADRLLHDAARGVGARGGLVLRLRQAEEDDGGHARVEGRRGVARDFVDREVEDAGHRRDLAAHPLAGAREEREHEALARQTRLAHERAQALAAPEPARAVDKVSHGLDSSRGQ